MPSAAWLAAAKKTPSQPVLYAACESVDAINVRQHLQSDWESGAMTNLEIFNQPGAESGAGLRNKVDQTTLSVTMPTQEQLDEFYPPPEPMGNSYGNFTTAKDCYIHSVKCQVIHAYFTGGDYTIKIHLFDITGAWQVISSTNYFDASFDVSGYSYTYAYMANVDVEFVVPALIQAGRQYRLVVEYSTDAWGWMLIHTTAESLLRFREINASIITSAFDMGTTPNIPSRLLIDDTVTGAATLIYTAEGSANGSTWTDLGTTGDGLELPPYRYYRITASFHSTGYDTPELYDIRVVGGNRQYVYLGTMRNEPVVASGEVKPYLLEVSSTSSKIELKDKATVGDLTLKLAWMPDTADLVQATGKRRSMTLYLGFAGLAVEDYEPYFTGIWESYTADQDKRVFTVKLRDVWKKLKKKIPEQQIKNGRVIDSTFQFGKTTDGPGTALNIIDAIKQICDMAKAPDRYIDKAELDTLKAAHYSGDEWNVYRMLSSQEDTDKLLTELAVTAGIFLVPSADGKLTPKHYETLAAATPAVTLDAAQIKFSDLTPDMAETVTRHNIYFNLIDGESTGSADSYANIYSTIGTEATVVAERDREEIVIGNWFDNWGLAAKVADGVPNPITWLADRLQSWHTPTATVGGKKVATTKTSVKAQNVPLRYFADVEPGSVVYVNNLRLPCPKAEWGGFSDNVKFLVMKRDVDSSKFTITLELFQISALSYTASPTWASYDVWNIFPSASGLALAEQIIIGVDGVVYPQVSASFTMPADYRAGSYEVWYSDNGGERVLYTSLSPSQGSAVVSFPAVTGHIYDVTVVVVNGQGKRQPFEQGQSASITVTGAGSIATPETTGLSVEGGGTTFAGRDCPLVWDAATIPATLLVGYKVDILGLDDVLKRSVTVKTAYFTYTYAMNVADFGTATPSFKVRVATVNSNGSDATPQTITVAKGYPAAPTVLAASGEPAAIKITATYVQDESFDALEIWSATTNDRTGAALVGTTKTGEYPHSGLGGSVTRYYWARVRDVYGHTSDYYPSGVTAGVTGTSTIGENPSTAIIYIYQRSATAPALPTATTTYTFATGVLTGLDGGWSATIPAGTDPLYVAASTAVGAAETDDIASTEWSTPVILASQGPAGLNSATVYLFQRTATSTPPIKPSATLTYTFATGVLSGTLGSWAQSMPSTGGAYRWMTTATAVASADTDTIASTEWANVSLMSQDGADGAVGASAVSGLLTNEVHSVPTNADGTGGDYSGATGTFKVYLGKNDITTSCTFSVTTNADVTGETIGFTTGIYSITGMSTDRADITFTATTPDGTSIPKVFTVFKAKKGADGTDAQYVTVTGPQAFKFDAGVSVPSPSSISPKATLFGGLTTYDWEYWTGSAWANLSGTQNASTYTLAYDNAAWGSASSLRIRCLSGTAYDEMTIIKVYDGADGSNGTNGTNGTNGKTYVLNIINGVRGFLYDLSGSSPSPAATAFSCTLTEDGVSVTPATYAWATGGTSTGMISGSGTASTFTPTIAATYDATKGNNYVMLTVTYAGQTIKQSVPIGITKTGATGETGPAGPGVNRATTPPASPVVGQLWYNTGTTDGTYYANTQYVWSGSAWQVAGPRGTFLNAAGAYIGALTADQVNAVDITADSITAGTFTGLTFQTASSGQRVVINASDNQFHSYGNKGNGTVIELATIGVPSYGGNGCVAIFGSTSSGTSKVGVVGASYSVFGVQGTSVTDTGVLGTSTSGIGIHASSESNIGMQADTNSGTHAVAATNGLNSATAIGVEGYAYYGIGVVGTGGVWDFHAEGAGTNGPFTGAHDALIPATATYDVGDIVVDTEVYARQNVSSTLAKVRTSNTVKEKAVIGVVSMKDIPDNIPVAIKGDSSLMLVLNDYDAIIINALGEGQINVCKDGGNIEAGDLICSSSRAGKGMKQDDDLLHNYTVAKAREACVWAEGEDDIRMIACTYHCG